MKGLVFLCVLGCTVLIGPTVYADLIHQWEFEDEFVDSVGDADGTGFGSAGITDDAKVGSGALLVNGIGSGDYVEVADDDSLDFGPTQSYTLAAWVKPTQGVTNWSGVITKGRDLGPWWGIWIDPNSMWTYGASDGSSLTGPGMMVNKWTHVAIVQDGISGTRKLFINAVLAASGTAGNSVNNGNLAMGRALSVDEWFVGVIDDVRIYDEPLDEQELVELAGIVPVSNLVCSKNGTGGADLGWDNNPLADTAIPIRIEVNGNEVTDVPGDSTSITLTADQLSDTFNEICVINSSGLPSCCEFFAATPEPIHHWDFEDDFSDSVGNADGTAVGMANITDDARVGSGALLVNGMGDYVEVIDDDSLDFDVTQSYTLAAWVKPTQGVTNWSGVVTKGRDLGPWWGIWIDPDSMWHYGVSSGTNLTGTVAMINKWTHVAIVQNGFSGTRGLYINGVLAASGSAANSVNAGNLAMGGALSVEEWFVGVIDDVRIYDEPLGEQELVEIAGIAPVSNLVCVKNGTGGVDLGWDNNPLADTATPIRIEVNGSEVTKVQGDATSVTLTAENLSDSFNNICVINSSNSPACCEFSAGTPEPIHHWDFEDDFSDSVGNADGTAVGMADITDDAKIGSGALIVNGMGDYVEVTDDDSLDFDSTQSYTLAAWVKPVQGVTNWSGVVTKGRDLGPWWGIWIDPATLWTYGASDGSSLTGPIAEINNWTHVAIVQNSITGTRKLYVNGVLVATGNTGDSVNAGNLAMGGALSVDEWFVGVIDDVLIYDQPLTEDNIKNIMEGVVEENNISVFTGDCNDDGSVNLADAITILSYLFSGGADLPCEKAADVNNDDNINLADAITVLSYMFNGATLRAPDGVDLASDNVGCQSYPVDTVTGGGLGCEKSCAK